MKCLRVCLAGCRFVDSGEMSESFPYRSKALFAFEDIDGADVCFFGMHVQEYGSDAPPPNQRQVSLNWSYTIVTNEGVSRVMSRLRKISAVPYDSGDFHFQWN